MSEGSPRPSEARTQTLCLALACSWGPCGLVGYLGEELLQAAGGHPSAAAPVMVGDPEGASGTHEGCEQHLLRL